MGPLTGLKVIEIASLGPGPFCGMMLADMGADVVRVDRRVSTNPVPGDPTLDVLNRSKRSVVIDLKQDAGSELVLDMVDRADVLLEGFRPGVCERLGIGPDVCLERNPRLIYGRMTGWGQAGPLAMTAGHDINYLALAGGLHSVGHADRPPVPPLNLVADFGGGGMLLAFGVVAALHERTQSGLGQVIDAAMVDGVGILHAMVHTMRNQGTWSDARYSNLLDGSAPFYTTYRCADERFVAVGALEPQFYHTFVSGLGLDPDEFPQSDRGRWEDYRLVFAERFATKSVAAWIAIFEGTDACVTPVLAPSEVDGHEHLRERAVFIPAAGGSQPAPAPRFSRSTADEPRPPPLPGRDTMEVLRSWGIDADRIEALQSVDAVG